MLLAIYPAGQFFGAPRCGARSRIVTAGKPVLLASLALALVCYALIAVAIATRQLLLLGIGCLIGGLSESNIAIAQSAIADVARPEDRGRLFAYVYSACSLGYIAGPLLGGQIAEHFGYEIPFWIVSALLGATLLWTLWGFRETHAPEGDKPLDYGTTFSNLLTVFTDRPIRRLYLINFLFYLTLFGYFRVIIIYMVARWHMAAQVSTAYYSYMAVMSMTASLVLTGPLLNRFGAKRLASISAILAGIGMIIIVLPTNAMSLVFTAGPDQPDRDADLGLLRDSAVECGERGQARACHGQQPGAAGWGGGRRGGCGRLDRGHPHRGAAGGFRSVPGARRHDAHSRTDRARDAGGVRREAIGCDSVHAGPDLRMSGAWSGPPAPARG